IRLHRAVSLELSAFVDAQQGSGEIACDLRRRTDFDFFRSGYVAGHFAAHDNRCSLDLRCHNGSLSDLETVLRVNLAINFAIDSRRAVKRQLAGDLGSAIEEGDSFGARGCGGPERPGWFWSRSGGTGLGLRTGSRLDWLNLWTLFGLLIE